MQSQMHPRTARERGWKKVGEVAEMLGTTTRALLYYEEQGIIEPNRTVGGTRYYSPADIRRFSIAHRLVAAGIPMRTVQELATVRLSSSSGRQSSHRLCPLVDRLASQIDAQVTEMSALRDDMVRASAVIRRCWDCDRKPTRKACPDCPCEQRLGDAELLRLTWDPDREN